MADRDTLLQILELARWAPSGDNTQPWRLDIVGPDHIAVHGHDTRDEVLYDFHGHPSHMAHGALLETLRIAATQFGFAASWSLREGGDERRPIYDVLLRPEACLAPDELLPYVRSRVVQRRPMRATPLTAVQRAALSAAVGPEFDLQFFESIGDRFAVARLLWENARLRLTCPEAYRVHRDIIEWNAQFSIDRIPDQAVGVDSLTAKLMRWVMQSWERVDFFNRYLFGTIAPRVQLDLIPALACSAHVLMKASQAPRCLQDHVRAGIAMQRLWLTATSQGLHLQPEMTPVIFRWYARSGERISALPAIDSGAARLAAKFESLVGGNKEMSFAFFCRVGTCSNPRARSTRLPLEVLIKR